MVQVSLIVTMSCTVIFGTVSAGQAQDHQHQGNFQYASLPAYGQYEFGFNRGNPNHYMSRYEQGNNWRFRTKVRWGDKNVGYGEHYWDYNHADKTKGNKGKGHGQPSQGHGQPSQGHGQPSQGHGQPSQGHGQPSQGHGQPSQGHGQPSQGHGQPSQGHWQPSQGHGQPSQGHGQPSQVLGHEWFRNVHHQQQYGHGQQQSYPNTQAHHGSYSEINPAVVKITQNLLKP